LINVVKSRSNLRAQRSIQLNKGLLALTKSGQFIEITFSWNVSIVVFVLIIVFEFLGVTLGILGGWDRLSFFF
jgi:hypothetical protein